MGLNPIIEFSIDETKRLETLFFENYKMLNKEEKINFHKNTRVVSKRIRKKIKGNDELCIIERHPCGCDGGCVFLYYQNCAKQKLLAPLVIPTRK